MIWSTDKAPPGAILVVITIYNGREMTADCLRSLQQSTYPRVMPLIVDNASQDGSSEYLRGLFPELAILRNERNLGVTRSYNQGIREGLARGFDYILIMNNDVILEPDCFARLMDRASRPDAPDILGPLMMYHAEPRRPWFCGGYVSVEKGDNGHCETLEDFRRLPQGERFITTCAFLMKAEVPRRIGFFDERYFMYCDDPDYSLRASAAGFRMDIVEDAILYHRVSASSGGLSEQISPFHAYQILRSGLLFWRKHQGFWRFHTVWCRKHLGNWINSIYEWAQRPERRAAADALVDALWYFLAGLRKPLERPVAPRWFRNFVTRRPWVVAELMGFRLDCLWRAWWPRERKAA